MSEGKVSKLFIYDRHVACAFSHFTSSEDRYWRDGSFIFHGACEHGFMALYNCRSWI
jgi:hypothetical protein